MLKIISVTPCDGEKWTKNHFVTLNLSKGDTGVLSGTFLDANFVMGANLEKVGTPQYEEDAKTIDWDATLAKYRADIVGKSEPNVYGFSLAISELYEGAKALKLDNDRTISMRNCIGMGANEASARIDAIQREKARLDYAINVKGSITIVREKEEEKGATD